MARQATRANCIVSEVVRCSQIMVEHRKYFILTALTGGSLICILGDRGAAAVGWSFSAAGAQNYRAEQPS